VEQETPETPPAGVAAQGGVAEEVSEPAAENAAVEAETQAVAAEETAEQSGTMENEGCPQNQPGAGPEEGRGQ
jgi:hypothetical protein